MRHSFLDRYSHLDSPIHTAPVSAKISALLVIVVSAVLGPGSSAVYFLILLGALSVVAALARIPARYILRRLAFLELVVGTVAVLSLFRPGGVHLFLVFFARSTVCLFAVVLFANTTPFSVLLEHLRRWHVPSILISILALLYRYIFVLVDEMERMQRARISRTFTANRSAARASMVTVVAQAFVRSAERAERIFAAMSARGWQ